MHFTRTIVSIVGVLLVVGMFFLPRVVVEDEEAPQSESGSVNATPEISQAHSRELTESERKQIEELKEGFKNQDNTEKSANFADSLAKKFAELNFLDSAAFYYGEAAQLNPSFERLMKAGNSHFEAFSYAVDLAQQDYWGKLTRSYFQKVLESDEELSDVKAKMALTYLPQQPMEAVMLLREVVDSDPNNGFALYNLGLLSLQSRQYDKAVERFQKLTMVEPDNLEGQFYLGVAYFESGATDLAREQFLKVKQLEPDPEVQANIEAYLKELK